MYSSRIGCSLQDASTEVLLWHARDVLALAGQRPDRRAAYQQPIDMDNALGALRQTSQALADALDGVFSNLARQYLSGTISVVEGPFVGDLDDAVVTATRWLATSHHIIDELNQALTNAHIAAGGLAYSPADQTHRRKPT